MVKQVAHSKGWAARNPVFNLRNLLFYGKENCDEV